jgi:hypothetical protein
VAVEVSGEAEEFRHAMLTAGLLARVFAGSAAAVS